MKHKFFNTCASPIEVSDNLLLFGQIQVDHIRDGEIISSQIVKNTVTSAGKAGLAASLHGATATTFNYLAIGTGTAAAAVGDTALGSEVTTSGGARSTATVSTATTDTTGDTSTWVHQWDFTGSFTVTESGIFNAASSGTLLARQVFSAINVISGDSLQLTWRLDLD
jgi:hypothetical protein